MRLETEDGHFVATVRPQIAMGLGVLPDEVVFWGTRVFVRKQDRPGGPVWRETMPLVVVIDPGG